MKLRYLLKSEKGAALITVILMLICLMIAGVGIIFVTTHDGRGVKDDEHYTEAYYYSRSAVDLVAKEILAEIDAGTPAGAYPNNGKKVALLNSVNRKVPTPGLTNKTVGAVGSGTYEHKITFPADENGQTPVATVKVTNKVKNDKPGGGNKLFRINNITITAETPYMGTAANASYGLSIATRPPLVSNEPGESGFGTGAVVVQDGGGLNINGATLWGIENPGRHDNENWSARIVPPKNHDGSDPAFGKPNAGRTALETTHTFEDSWLYGVSKAGGADKDVWVKIQNPDIFIDRTKSTFSYGGRDAGSETGAALLNSLFNAYGVGGNVAADTNADDSLTSDVVKGIGNSRKGWDQVLATWGTGDDQYKKLSAIRTLWNDQNSLMTQTSTPPIISLRKKYDEATGADILDNGHLVLLDAENDPTMSVVYLDVSDRDSFGERNGKSIKEIFDQSDLKIVHSTIKRINPVSTIDDTSETDFGNRKCKVIVLYDSSGSGSMSINTNNEQIVESDYFGDAGGYDLLVIFDNLDANFNFMGTLFSPDSSSARQQNPNSVFFYWNKHATGAIDENGDGRISLTEKMNSEPANNSSITINQVKTSITTPLYFMIPNNTQKVKFEGGGGGSIFYGALFAKNVEMTQAFPSFEFVPYTATWRAGLTPLKPTGYPTSRWDPGRVNFDNRVNPWLEITGSNPSGPRPPGPTDGTDPDALPDAFMVAPEYTLTKSWLR
ncbi:MAG: hypothetical protein LBU36_07450 [Clostridiales bacterium]|jgi:hypothetical protein|nr:hypothetical protein [Clostridiales bacterium]